MSNELKPWEQSNVALWVSKKGYFGNITIDVGYLREIAEKIEAQDGKPERIKILISLQPSTKQGKGPNLYGYALEEPKKND